MLDQSGQILHANQAALDLLGWASADYIGQSFEHFFEDSDVYNNIMEDLQSGQTIRATRVVFRGADGLAKSLIVDANACFEGKKFQYARLFVQDVAASGLIFSDSSNQLEHDVLKVLNESSTVSEALSRLVPLMAMALGCEVGLVWKADEKANRLERLVLWRSDPHGEANHLLSKSNNISLVVSSGFPAELWFSDSAHKIVAGKNVRFCGSEMSLTLPEIKQILSVPIAIGRLNWGLFGFFSRNESEVSVEYLAGLQSLGRQIGKFIERQQSLENYQKMQESYSLAIAGANDGIWDWDFTTNQVFFSPRWKSLLGFEDHELDNHFDTFRALTHPDDYPRVMDAVQHHMETRETYAEEFRMRTKEGEYIWISARGLCSYNAMGQPVRMSGSHRDISDIKEAELARARSEARLLESESKFRQLAENMQEVFWILSADRQEFCYISPAFEAFWPATCQDLYKNASIFFDCMVDEDRERIFAKLDAGAIDQNGLELEFRIYSSLEQASARVSDAKSAHSAHSALDGQISDYSYETEEPDWRWMWTKIFPISDEQGKLARLCGIAHDISDKKEMEKRVNDFYSTISHELRTPLTSIRAALGLVEGGLVGDISSETQEYTTIARDNCDRLIRLINDMLDLKKVEANRLELHLQRLGVMNVIQTTVDSLRPYAEERGVKVSAPDCSVPDCLGDSDRVIQILTNLLANAIRYTPSGKNVLVKSVDGINGGVRFIVKDEGPGIAESKKQDLFGPFQQLSCVENDSNKGTGLGLAISKVLVERLNGTIGVNSRLGEGAEFWFELPLFADDQTNDCDRAILPESERKSKGTRKAAEGNVKSETKSVDKTAAEAAPTVSPAQLAQILLVEDSDSIALILKGLLVKKGYAVERTATISEAKEFLQRKIPDLIITDVHLPDGNGITFVNWLHDEGNSSHKNILVVVLSGVDANPKSLKHPDLVDWVRKPFDGEQLLSLLKDRLNNPSASMPHQH